MIGDHQSVRNPSQDSGRDGVPDTVDMIQLSVEIERCSKRLAHLVPKMIAANGAHVCVVALFRKECLDLASAAVRLASAADGRPHSSRRP